MRKLKKSEKNKKIVSLIKQIAGSSKSSTLSKKSLKKKNILSTNAFETLKFKIIDTWYDENKEDECTQIYKTRPITNPKATNRLFSFRQMYYFSISGILKDMICYHMMFKKKKNVDLQKIFL